jgi:hypothetical protein
MGGAGKFSLHPPRWRPNQELEGRADLVGKKFSAEEKDVLSHIYDRHFKGMLGLLMQAEFNWIWVAWSSGWSLKDENENREGKGCSPNALGLFF